MIEQFAGQPKMFSDFSEMFYLQNWWLDEAQNVDVRKHIYFCERFGGGKRPTNQKQKTTTYSCFPASFQANRK